MEYLPEFLAVTAIHFLAVVSPGPDFAMICRNSLAYSRRTGVYSAIGLGLGILVHVTYSLVGIGFIISRSIFVFSILKYIGAAYLIYLGWQALRTKPAPSSGVEVPNTHADLGRLKAIGVGFLTNVTNPKATLFFLALFTQVINSSTPLFIKTLYGVEMSVVTSAWFALLAIMVGHSAVKRKLSRIHHRVTQAMGVILIGLGIRVALSSSK